MPGVGRLRPSHVAKPTPMSTGLRRRRTDHEDEEPRGAVRPGAPRLGRRLGNPARGARRGLRRRPGRYTAWLTTINADGSPHVTGVGARWDDGAYWIVSARTARKGRNLERDPRCAVSLSTKGYDVVVEGMAELVTDPDVVAAAAERYAAGGWPCEVDESGTALTAPFSAPSAGPPPWHLYRVTPTKATGVHAHDPGARRPGRSTTERWDQRGARSASGARLFHPTSSAMLNARMATSVTAVAGSSTRVVNVNDSRTRAFASGAARR